MEPGDARVERKETRGGRGLACCVYLTLPPEAMMESLAAIECQVWVRGYAELGICVYVCGSYFYQRPCGHPWCRLLPGTILMCKDRAELALLGVEGT